MSESKNGELKIRSVKVKGNTATLTLSDEQKIELSVDSCMEFHLYEGKELKEKEWKNILSLLRQDECYRAGIRMLSRDSYSSYQLKKKLLAKGHEIATVRQVITRLQKAKLLDDERFAHNYAEDIGELRLLGSRRIQADLRQKGISDEILQTLNFSEEKEMEKAIRCAERFDKRYSLLPYGRRLNHIHRLLLQRGFTEAIANDASTSCTSGPNPEVEQAELEKQFEIANRKYAPKYAGYDLSRHIFAYLVRKGFGYEEVKSMLEDKQEWMSQH